LYETNRLKQLCNKWETNLDRLQKYNSSSKDEIEEEISLAIGKTKILLNGRFSQTNQLIEEFNATKEKAKTPKSEESPTLTFKNFGI